MSMSVSVGVWFTPSVLMFICANGGGGGGCVLNLDLYVWYTLCCTHNEHESKVLVKLLCKLFLTFMFKMTIYTYVCLSPNIFWNIINVRLTIVNKLLLFQLNTLKNGICKLTTELWWCKKVDYAWDNIFTLYFMLTLGNSY